MHLAELLHDLLVRLETRQPIALPPAEELTPQEAAQLLQVSPAEITRFVEEGSSPHHQVRSRRLVYREDVLAYPACASPSDEAGAKPGEYIGHR